MGHSLFTTKARGAGEAKRAKKIDKATPLLTNEEDGEISTLLEDFDPEEYYEAAKVEKERRKHHKENRLR